MRPFLLVVPLAFTGCASSWADMGGTIGGADFTHPQAVYHGGQHIVFLDRKLGCDQVGWVARRYTEGVSPRPELEFVALQLTSRDGFDAEGTRSLFDGPVKVQGLVNEHGGFEVHHGRDGQLVVERVGDDWIEGTVSVSFANDGVAGTFRSERCRSLEL